VGGSQQLTISQLKERTVAQLQRMKKAKAQQTEIKVREVLVKTQQQLDAQLPSEQRSEQSAERSLELHPAQPSLRRSEFSKPQSGGFSADDEEHCRRKFCAVANEDGQLDLPRFMGAFFGVHMQDSRNALLEQLFNAVDKDGDGCISCEEYIALVKLIVYGSPEERAHFVHRVYAGSEGGGVRRCDMKKLAKAALHTPNSPVKLLAPEFLQGGESQHQMRQSLHDSVDACFVRAGAKDRDRLTKREFINVCRASSQWEQPAAPPSKKGYK